MLTDCLHVYHDQEPFDRQAHVDDADDAVLYTDSLASLFRDDTQCQHGTDGAQILYNSSRFGPMELSMSSPDEKNRKLFAHYLWNAEVHMAEEISSASTGNVWDMKEQRVLELGAGLGLAGILSALAGAARAVISDYPTPDLLANIARNVKNNVTEKSSCLVEVQGHTWGQLQDDFSSGNAHQFSRILVADCLWMPEQHLSLAQSIAHFLTPGPAARALIVAGFHSGRDRMVPFFKIAEQEGMRVFTIHEVDVESHTRPWQLDRGDENVFERKRWLVVAVLGLK